MKKSVVITIIAISILALGVCAYLFLWNKPNNPIDETPSPTLAVTPLPTQSETPPVTLTTKFDIADFQRVDGSTVTLPLMQLFAVKTTNATQEEIDNNLKHNKTYQAFNNLTNKDESDEYSKDIIFTTLQSEETISSSSVELEIKPIAQDGFVFLVNKENPVQSLTKQQIIDIYTGKITNWKQVGGDDAKISAYQRQRDSGSQDGMFDLVMGDKKINNSVTAIANSMEGLVDSIANYENSKYAIGYSYYYFTTVQYVKENTKLLSIDGVQPTIANFSNGSYPLVAKYYAIIRADEPQDSFAWKFLNLVLSDDGQKIVEEAGYVKIHEPQTTPPESTTAPTQALKKSPVSQPTEFISQTWNKYETMFEEQGNFNFETNEYTSNYFDVVMWFRAQYSQYDLYGDSEYNPPSNLIKGSINTNNGQVITYLFKATIPLKDTALATQIGQTVIAKVNDIATNPTKYGVNIKKTSGDTANGDFGFWSNYSMNNELLIYVERYAFNNIIAYSINFFVPTDDYYVMSGGGPWGTSCHQGYRFGMNFDAKTGKQITWEDIFADNADYKSEIASYQEYRSFIDEMPKTTEFNYDKMFLLTPTNILIGDDYNSVYCENKNLDFFDNRQYREFDGSVDEHYDTYGYKGGDKLVDIKHSEKDIPLKFFNEKIALFERYKTTDNLWNSSVEAKSWKFPTNTLNGWEYSN